MLPLKHIDIATLLRESNSCVKKMPASAKGGKPIRARITSFFAAGIKEAKGAHFISALNQKNISVLLRELYVTVK